MQITLNLTKQEIIEANRRAVEDGILQAILPSPNGSCNYRSEGGTRKCAIGCVLPDMLYHSAMEGDSVSRMMDSRAYPSQSNDGSSYEFLLVVDERSSNQWTTDLQRAHDQWITGQDDEHHHMHDEAHANNRRVGKQRYAKMIYGESQSAWPALFDDVKGEEIKVISRDHRGFAANHSMKD